MRQFENSGKAPKGFPVDTHGMLRMTTSRGHTGGMDMRSLANAVLIYINTVLQTGFYLGCVRVELTGRVAEIESELRKPLSADSEERATDLENQEALETIENSEMHEIRQIQEALNRISEGSYGICAECGADIDPKRLRALPTATRCISCAA